MAALPEGLKPGTWNVDGSHTEVGFAVRHAGISKTRGGFESVEGTLVTTEDYEASKLDLKIAIDSISTRNADRDGHLKSADFFDAEQFPYMTFTSTELKTAGEDVLVGDLTIRGTTKQVGIDFDFNGAATDPFGYYRAGFTGTTTINRQDFGLTWNAALEAGGFMVGDKVKIEFDIEFVLPEA